jgi:sulfur carrier protein
MKPLDPTSIDAPTIVNVNGAPHPIEPGTSVAALIASLGHAPESVAVAVDAVFVPRSLRAERLLHGGEQLTCFQPIVGG